MKNAIIIVALIILTINVTNAYSKDKSASYYVYTRNPEKGDECVTMHEGTAPKSWRPMNPYRSIVMLEKLNDAMKFANATGGSVEEIIDLQERNGLVFDYPKGFRFIVTDTFTVKGKKKKSAKLTFLQFKQGERYFEVSFANFSNNNEIVCRRLKSSSTK